MKKEKKPVPVSEEQPSLPEQDGERMSVRCYSMSSSSAKRWLEENRQGSVRRNVINKERRDRKNDPSVRRRGRILLTVLSVAAAVGVLIPAGILIFRQFVINECEISGDTGYSAAELLAATGLGTGDSIIKASLPGVAGRICETLPYVKECRVGVSLPDKVTIEAYDYIPGFYLESGGDYFAVSEELRVLEKDSSPDRFEEAGILKVKVPPVSECIVGRDLVFSGNCDGKSLRELIGLLRDADLYSGTAELDMSDIYATSVTLTGGGTVYFGDCTSLKQKFETALRVIGECGGSFNTIDVCLPGSAYLRKD